VFVGRLATPDYLARCRCADLFLDTFPYNAGTTASDALWSGLPILTRQGETFSSRMAGSLLEALGVPELITSSTVEYEELAVKLATRPEFFAAIKDKLAQGRKTGRLFDTLRHTRTLEQAYVRMLERHDVDLPPADVMA
jgi:predicted O-linked N-acetylglucosamine transferase (SPINDLY family)